MRSVGLIAFVVYATSVVLLLIYALNVYWLIGVVLRKRRRMTVDDQRDLERWNELPGEAKWPLVTSQVPIFNELNVAERVIRAVGALEYPAGKHSIQVLDDSTDETSDLLDRLCLEMSHSGVDIKILRRGGQNPGKAESLRQATATAAGDYVALFDADFVPSRDFLLRTIPFLEQDPELAFVQSRWEHLNATDSVVTRAQALALDGHFVIEQGGREMGNCFINFNGTAGVWARRALDACGGWSASTLTEDMNMAYRAQLQGWKGKFLWWLSTPAELPRDLNAYKSQQYRWARGSAQNAKAFFGTLITSQLSLRERLQGLLHLTHYAIHPLIILVGVAAGFMLWWQDFPGGDLVFKSLAVALLAAAFAPICMYVVASVLLGNAVLQRLMALPVLLLLGAGFSINNTIAFFAGLLVKNRGSFVRTIKHGDRGLKTYGYPFPWTSFLDLLFAAYCAVVAVSYLQSTDVLIGHFLPAYGLAFGAVGITSMAHYRRTTRGDQSDG